MAGRLDCKTKSFETSRQGGLYASPLLSLYFEYQSLSPSVLQSGSIRTNATTAAKCEDIEMK